MKATGFKSEESPSALSMWAVALVSFLPVAPVLQVPYAESLNLVFLAGALLYLVQGRYGLAGSCGGFGVPVRPVGVPWARLPACGGLCWVRSSRQSGMGTAFVRHLGQLVSALGCACALVGLRLRGGLRAVWMRTPPRETAARYPVGADSAVAFAGVPVFWGCGSGAVDCADFGFYCSVFEPSGA